MTDPAPAAVGGRLRGDITSPSPRSSPAGRGRSADALITSALFCATVLYWMSLPHSLQPADESVHLYEAKRLLDGEVLYRDFFNFITPGWFYLIAALFWLFGTTIVTARATMAVVHGLAMVLIYLTCRRLGVRRSLAWWPALAYLALCQSAFPMVSQHWISTVLCAALVFIAAGRIRGRSPTFALALTLGALIGVQQQRGAFMAAGTLAWLVGDDLLNRRYGAIVHDTRRQAVRLTVATAIVVGIVLAFATLQSTFAAVWYALVTFPLFNYRNEMSCRWGDVNLLTGWYAQFTLTRVLAYSPVVLVVSAVRWIVAWVRRRDRDEARGLLLLLIFSAASAASIAYFPDFIKIAFIAFVFFIAAIENVEWLARIMPGPAWLPDAVAWVGGAALLVAGTQHLYSNRVQLQHAYPVSHETAFGRIDYGSVDEARLRDQLDTLLRAAPSRALYGYPILADLYLTVPADNPTPYGFFFASGYHTPEQVQHVIDLLRQRRLPYIVALPGFQKPDDPVFRFITEEYTPMLPAPLAGRMIYRHK